jgi:hypothetical protein
MFEFYLIIKQIIIKYNEYKKLKYENRKSTIQINLDIQYNKIINMSALFIATV